MKSRQTNAPAIAAAKAGIRALRLAADDNFQGAIVAPRDRRGPGPTWPRTDVAQDRRGPGPTWPRTDVAQDRRGPGPSPASLAMMFELPCRK